MTFFEKTVAFLNSEMECPETFGVFHIASFLIMAVLTSAAVMYFRNKSERDISRLALIAWIIILVFEVYKQFVYTFEYEDGELVREYSWYIFPFQFCSTPMYLLPLVAFLREGRVRDSALFFLGSYGLFAGLAVMVYPGNVFTETIGVDIQTMVHHGLQTALGVLFAVRYMRYNTKRRFLFSSAVFGVVLFIAFMLNVTLYPYLISRGIDTSFNMFYISPYTDCNLPILSALQPILPYPVFLAVYIVGFASAAWITVSLVRGISYLAGGIYAEKKSKDQ